MKLGNIAFLTTLLTVAKVSSAGRSNRLKGNFGMSRGLQDSDGSQGSNCCSCESDYGGKKAGYDGGYGGKKAGYDGGEESCSAGKKGSYGGKGGEGSYGGKKGYGSEIPEDSCVICNKNNKNKPDELTLTYNPNGKNSAFQGMGKASCREREYPENARVTVNEDEEFDVEEGASITISLDGGAYTYFWFDDTEDEIDFYECFIHTSCSAPIVKGDQIGPWIIGDGDEDCEKPPTPECPCCDICTGGKPGYLTLKYHSVGADSEYQTADQASCGEGEYPEEATITVEGETLELEDGDEFTITARGGKFGAFTTFRFEDIPNCYIHTSCSAPLIPGDQIGPFEVIGGPGCDKSQCSECINAVVTEVDGETVIDVTFDYTNLSVDRDFVDNCADADADCPITDLAPKGSDWIGFYPCDAQEQTPPFRTEPEIWAYTCYDSNCRDAPEATSEALVSFSDKTIPAFGTQSPLHKTIEQLTKNGGGCYIVLLNRIDGFSAPPYYNICKGNEITLPDKS